MPLIFRRYQGWEDKKLSEKRRQSVIDWYLTEAQEHAITERFCMHFSPVLPLTLSNPRSANIYFAPSFILHKKPEGFSTQTNLMLNFASGQFSNWLVLPSLCNSLQYREALRRKCKIFNVQNFPSFCLRKLLTVYRSSSITFVRQ